MIVFDFLLYESEIDELFVDYSARSALFYLINVFFILESGKQL